jgi:hypothetical protein
VGQWGWWDNGDCFSFFLCCRRLFWISGDFCSGRGVALFLLEQGN